MSFHLLLTILLTIFSFTLGICPIGLCWNSSCSLKLFLTLFLCSSFSPMASVALRVHSVMFYILVSRFLCWCPLPLHLLLHDWMLFEPVEVDKGILRAYMLAEGEYGFVLYNLTNIYMALSPSPRMIRSNNNNNKDLQKAYINYIVQYMTHVNYPINFDYCHYTVKILSNYYLDYISVL